MSDAPAQPVAWFEVATRDPEASTRFYSELFGWTTSSMPIPGMEGINYTMLHSPGSDTPFSGVMPMTPEWGDFAPQWCLYLSTDDVDAAASKAVELGGTVMVPAFDIPGVGRIAGIIDPSGAFFYLMKSAESGGELNHPAVWFEVYGKTEKTITDFYGGLFGWTSASMPYPGKEGAHYTMLGAPQPFAGVQGMDSPEWEGFAPVWAVFFGVEDVDATVAKAVSLGAKIKVEPMSIPTVGRMAAVEDPQGAWFFVMKGEPM